MTSVFLTGASGFIGSGLSSRFPDNFRLRQAFRVEPVEQPISEYVLCDFNDDTSLSLALKGIDVVIHCAGRAHLLNDNSKNAFNEFRKVNVDITLNLAHAAVNSGVKRFIFLSSIGVNGNLSASPFTEKNTPSPVEGYAFSKLEAEQGLQKIAASSGMEVVIIRPPLVYGPGAPGNFRRLIGAVSEGRVLPLGLVHNKRSFVALDNLVDLIITCIDHPAAANQIFLVSDGEDLSTTELLRRVGHALGKPAKLLPVPAWIISLAATLIGKRDVSQRLLGSLQVDISKTRDLLGWVPPVSVDEALQKTAQSFLLKK